MRRLAIIITALVLALPAVAGAALPAPVQYGPEAADTAIVFPGGPTPLLLLHGKGQPAGALRGPARFLQGEGFTVFALNWQAAHGKGGIFPFETNQIEAAIAYVRSRPPGVSVDPSKLVIVGASRGALLGMLTAERANSARPGTVKALVSLSGQPNPELAIARARRGELASVMTANLTEAFGCTRELASCPEAYVREWSPIDDAAPTAPAMLLAASETEEKAQVPDQYEMAERLNHLGVDASVFVAPHGHASAYFGFIRDEAVEFLSDNGG